MTTYPTYEDRIAQAAEVLKTLTPEQVDAVKVLAGLMDTIGEGRNVLNGYGDRRVLTPEQQRNVDDFHWRLDQYILLDRAMYEVTKK